MEALRLALTFAEACSHGMEAIGALLANSCVFETASPAPTGLRYEGRTAITRAMAAFLEGKAELEMEAEDAYGLGRRGVDSFTVRDDAGQGPALPWDACSRWAPSTIQASCRRLDPARAPKTVHVAYPGSGGGSTIRIARVMPCSG
ncbi:MAG: nuclear transport factor 2 family protein [Polyangiaceae bacterium]|nr:nuclear transport factor 2 family protein [Polyangiaceae bacterium]